MQLDQIYGRMIDGQLLDKFLPLGKISGINCARQKSKLLCATLTFTCFKIILI